MKTIKVKISPDGKYQHIYNDALRPMDEALGDFKVHRATDVFFDNVERLWKIRDLSTNEVLLDGFEHRGQALSFEHRYLQEQMGLGERA